MTNDVIVSIDNLQLIAHIRIWTPTGENWDC